MRRPESRHGNGVGSRWGVRRIAALVASSLLAAAWHLGTGVAQDTCENEGLQINCLPTCVAADDILVIDSTGGGSASLLANDTCPASYYRSVSLLGPPVHGEASITPDGILTYRLSDGMHPPEQLHYGLVDHRGEPVAEASITLRVDTGTRARDDQTETEAAVGLRIDVLANDHLPVRDGLSLRIVEPPAMGTLSVTEDGQALHFQGMETDAGQITGRYEVIDRFGGTSQASVTIRVRPPFRCPDHLGPGWSMIRVPAGTWSVGDNPWLGRFAKSVEVNASRLDEPFCITVTELTHTMLEPFLEQLTDAERAPWLACPSSPVSHTDAVPCVTPAMAESVLTWLNGTVEEGVFDLPDARQWITALYYLNPESEARPPPEGNAAYFSMLTGLREWTRTACGTDPHSNTLLVLGLDDMLPGAPDKASLCRIASMPEDFVGVRLVYHADRD